MEKLYLINFYVPESHLEAVKQAMFAKGAGVFGKYDQCCWQTKGIGQFRPLDEANPNIGKRHQVTKIDEYKVEIICRKTNLKDCIDALESAHPYEVLAYQILPFYT